MSEAWPIFRGALEKVCRQKDEEFIALLNRIRNDSVDEEDMAHLNGLVNPDYEPSPNEFCITLTLTNKNADRINEARLSTLLPGKVFCSLAEIDGEFTK